MVERLSRKLANRQAHSGQIEHVRGKELKYSPAVPRSASILFDARSFRTMPRQAEEALLDISLNSLSVIVPDSSASIELPEDR